MIRSYLFLLSLVILISACRQNTDITEVTETPLIINEQFSFTINDEEFLITDLRAWIEDHDTITVTQFENFGSGIPEVIFNIHGTGEGTYEVGDITIKLDETQYDPHFFKCTGCAILSTIDYFGDVDDFVIGTFEGEAMANETVPYPVSGSFSAIRQN